MTGPEATTIAQAIFHKYIAYFDGEIQNCSPLIADEICNATGATPVAGEITRGTQRRAHWWAELNSLTLDPMGDALVANTEDCAQRVEIHRNATVFNDILPYCEPWRVPDKDGSADMMSQFLIVSGDYATDTSMNRRLMALLGYGSGRHNMMKITREIYDEVLSLGPPPVQVAMVAKTTVPKPTKREWRQSMKGPSSNGSGRGKR